MHRYRIVPGLAMILLVAASTPAWAKPKPKPAAAAPAVPAAAIATTPPPSSPPPVAAAPEAQARKRYGRRSVIGLEFAPGVAIPFKKYLDFGGGQDSYSMENGPGFGFGLSLTLNNVELRWGYARLSAGHVVGRVPDQVAQAAQQYLGLALNQNIDTQASQPLVFHNITIGYRFTFRPTTNLRLAIPVGIGSVIAIPPSFGILEYTLFGIGGHVGFLTEYHLAGMLALGGEVRFSTYITEPDPNLAAAGLAATEKIFDNAIAWLPMLSIGVYARIYY